VERLTPRPADAHRGLVDARAYTVLGRSLQAVHGRFEYVLIGGWAVYSYGSRVPSVDTDLLVLQRDFAAVQAAVAVAQEPADAANCELLALDRFNHLLGQDMELGDPDLGYVARDLLQDEGITVRTIEAAGQRWDARVPRPSHLTFMKLKAYHDRELAWRALRDPAVMARIPPQERPEVRSKTEGYYLRKAGKDLYDIAFLCANVTSLEQAMELAERYDLVETLRAPLERLPLALRTFAQDLAEEDEPSLQWLLQRP
jgi:hypothetical protein